MTPGDQSLSHLGLTVESAFDDITRSVFGSWTRSVWGMFRGRTKTGRVDVRGWLVYGGDGTARIRVTLNGRVADFEKLAMYQERHLGHRAVWFELNDEMGARPCELVYSADRDIALAAAKLARLTGNPVPKYYGFIRF